jgi:NADPH2:quinone reductase
MTKAIRIHETGGPEVMKWEDVDVGGPGEGQVRLRQTAMGLNFIDCYHRMGLYPLPSLPAVIGAEAAAVIEEIGPGVTGLTVGQRVAYAPVPGAYAEERLIPATKLIALPDEVTDEQAASMMLQGMTARFLVKKTYAIQSGDTILIHAAAGGVGSIVCQWAKHMGATVIGTVGTDEKAELAKANGCDYPIVYTRESFKDRVSEITDGEGLPVVYDSIGKDTFDDSLDCLQPLGTMVTFGNASGPVPPMAPNILAGKGSLFLTRPGLVHYTGKREDLVETANDLFDVVANGHVKVSVNQTYALKDAAQAHIDLEARKTTGSTIFLP